MQRLQQRRTQRLLTLFPLSLAVFLGLSVGMELALIALWRWGGEAPRRRVAQLNKRWANPIVSSALKAGSRHSPYAVIEHTGRHTGRTYRTPVIARPADGTLVIPLAYGEHVDWYRNVQAAGGCTIEWQGASYALGAPVQARATTAMRAFPRWWRVALRLHGIHEFVTLPLAATEQTAGALPTPTLIARPQTQTEPRAPSPLLRRTDRETWPKPGTRGGATARTALEIWRATRTTPETITAHQRTRLGDLVAYARAHSPYYRDLYRQVPTEISDLCMLPPVTKQELMTHFDQCVTDPAVTKTGVKTFMAATAPGTQLYLDRFLVCTTSGISGYPGIFLHDQAALAIYRSLMLVRAALPWVRLGILGRLLRGGGRVAVLMVTDSHSVDEALVGYAAQRHPWLTPRLMRTFSVRRPMAELSDALNTFQPAVLVGYATALDALTDQQEAGRLHIAPQLVVTSAEWLAPARREYMANIFGCAVRDLYSATEFPGMAAACEHGTLHVNSDWVLLEPVDERDHRYEPVPAGQPSQTVLLTNLVNRTQPLIRYDLGDSITLFADPCPCGSPLPAMRVEGRRDETLYYQTAGGKVVPILPLALASVVEAAAGGHRFQCIQTALGTLRLRLDAASEQDRTQVGSAVLRHLRIYLETQGLPEVDIVLAAEPPIRDSVSGKYRVVWAEPGSLANGLGALKGQL